MSYAGNTILFHVMFDRRKNVIFMKIKPTPTQFKKKAIKIIHNAGS